MTDSEASKAKLYDIPQAAEYLSVSTKSVRRYIESGRITARKIKNVWYVEQSALDPLKGAVGKRGPRPLEQQQGISPEFMQKLEKTLGELNERISGIDNRLYLFSQQRESDRDAAALEEKESEIGKLTEAYENLRAENERLEDSLNIAAKEVEQIRSNGPRDTQAMKTKTEEIEELKATIVSNQRGLSLLREELADHKEQVRSRDTAIKDLKARLLELEQELDEHKRIKRTGGLLTSRRKT